MIVVPLPENMKFFRPMLSGKVPEDLSQLKYPFYVSPKLDGYRCIIKDGKALSRNLKPIRNRFIQKTLSQRKYEGYDGELIVGNPTATDCFRKTSSQVSSALGEPNFKFYVFDTCKIVSGWINRYNIIQEDEFIVRVPHHKVLSEEELVAYEEQFLLEGYEGLMVRSEMSPYKYGRSTEREAYLLKMKRFEDSEALVVGMEEKMHNANEAKINALGNTERTSHLANLVPMNTMGAVIVRDVHTGIEFNIGTGFDDTDRDYFWKLSKDWPFEIIHNQTRRYIPERLNIGQVGIANPIYMKYKFFPQGSKDKPRFPSYQGIRHEDDMSK